MKIISIKTFRSLVIYSSFFMSGCGMLGGGGSGGAADFSKLTGGLKNLIPSGAKLTDGPENELFMTANETASANLPYMAVSSGQLEPDGASLYGDKNFH